MPIDGLTISDSTVDPAMHAGMWMRGDNLTVEATTFTGGIKPLLAGGDGTIIHENSFVAPATPSISAAAIQ